MQWLLRQQLHLLTGSKASEWKEKMRMPHWLASPGMRKALINREVTPTDWWTFYCAYAILPHALSLGLLCVCCIVASIVCQVCTQFYFALAQSWRLHSSLLHFQGEPLAAGIKKCADKRERERKKERKKEARLLSLSAISNTVTCSDLTVSQGPVSRRVYVKRCRDPN